MSFTWFTGAIRKFKKIRKNCRVDLRNESATEEPVDAHRGSSSRHPGFFNRALRCEFQDAGIRRVGDIKIPRQIKGQTDQLGRGHPVIANEISVVVEFLDAPRQDAPADRIVHHEYIPLTVRRHVTDSRKLAVTASRASPLGDILTRGIELLNGGTDRHEKIAVGIDR